MKHEWRKEEKALYLPPRKPVLIDVPKMKFITVQGVGNPNEQPFSERVAVLYALSWTIRMMPKSGFSPDGYAEYTVYPLEGTWDLVSAWDDHTPLNKADLSYTVMIRQPDFVTPAVFAMAMEMAAKKKDVDASRLQLARLEEITDGLSVQMMHHGPFDDEPASFAQMKQLIEEQNLRRTGTSHREIYLSDPRKATPENMRTVLRYFVTGG